MSKRHEEGFSVSADRLGRNVRRLREARGWTQKKLGEELARLPGKAWPQSRLSEIESATHNKTIRMVDALARVFRVDVADLLSNVSPP